MYGVVVHCTNTWVWGLKQVSNLFSAIVKRFRKGGKKGKGKGNGKDPSSGQRVTRAASSG